MIENYNEIDEIADLITARITGTIDEAGRMKLEDWILASPENARLYERYTSEEFIVDKFRFIAEHDISASYQELMLKVKRAEQKRKVRFYRYAGVVAFFILLGGILYLGKENIVLSKPEKVARIIPGTYKAILTLADGSQVDLSEIKTDRKLDKEGTHMRIMSGAIRYATSDTSVMEEQYHTISIPRGGEYTLTLSDGSVLQMNSESEIRYPASFRSGTREVFMKGEVFFQVARDTTSPFVIHSEQGEIRVLGTSFNVRDYGDENFLETTLVNGKVAFERAGEQYTLLPGEQLRLDKRSGQTAVMPVDTRLYCSWTEGRFVFEKQRLEDIMNTLSRWYDIHVSYENQSLKDVLFTGNLKRYGELAPILDMLTLINKIDIEVDGNRVMIKDRK